MSGLYFAKQALQLLEQRMEKSALPSDVQLYIVTSFPRSDMGKGTLVAHMLHMLPDSGALKFDGLLNTNANGRHTARGHDDFGIYEKYNPTKHFGDEHYILGGYLYQDFITAYGEYENLTFRPYMVKHFMATIQEKWQAIGRPKNLIIELGGTLTDFEVEPYVAPAIRELKELYKARCQVILLTESGYNNEYIKTKTIQDSVSAFVERRILPDILIAREPSEVRTASTEERVEFERTIRSKLYEVFGIAFQKIVSVPFYKQTAIDENGDFLEAHLKPMITPLAKHSKILIGSNNPHKVADWRSFINDEFEVVAAKDLGLKLDVVEGMTSVKENSLAKAKAWCRISGLPTIADDTGFYIEALDGAPGVAVKRWAGALPETTTDEQFYNPRYDFLRKIAYSGPESE